MKPASCLINKSSMESAQTVLSFVRTSTAMKTYLQPVDVASVCCVLNISSVLTTRAKLIMFFIIFLHVTVQWMNVDLIWLLVIQIQGMQ